MRYTINATTEVRTFSELLNEIKYKGTVYTIERSGKPIAELSPVSSPAGKRTLSELPGILEALPKLGDDARTFAGDIERIRKKQPQVPKGDAWG